MDDRLGAQLGNYRLIELIGKGAFAKVYLGEHVDLGTQAAIKVFDSSQELTTEDIRRFTNEARTIAPLTYHHIVRVLDFGVEGKTRFLIMDYAPNGTLRQRHKRGVPIPLDTVVRYVWHIAKGLQFAHDKSVIHRDIKPENMLIGQRNEILLSDFGIAVVAQSSRNPRTQDMAGTANYMAPEQIEQHPRPASDQYSLAVVAYEWLTGEPPFHGTVIEVMAAHLHGDLPSLRDKLPTIPIAVEKVINKALSKDPHDRYSSVTTFAKELEKAAYEHLAPTLVRPTSTPGIRISRPLPRSIPSNQKQVDEDEVDDEGIIDDDEYEPPRPIPSPNSIRRYNRVPNRRSSPIRARSTPFQGPISADRKSPLDVDEYEYGVDEEERTPSVIPRRRQAPPRATKPINAPVKRQARQIHWLLPVGIAIIMLFIVWILGSAALSWGVNRYNDLRYGMPRTYQVDAIVGHNGDNLQHPSHFTVYNFNRQVVIVEFPAADSTKSIVYNGPVIVPGADADLSPITLEFHDVTGDHRPDMIVRIHLPTQQQIIVFVNTGVKFRPSTGNDNIRL